MDFFRTSVGTSGRLKAQGGRAASHPLIWMLIVAAVVSAVWWYPTARDTWLTPAAKPAGAGGPGAAWRFGGGGGRGQPVSVGEVQQMDVRLNVSALGTLTALNTAVVRAKVDGELKALRFTEGQQVQAGALLAEIDARATEVLLQQAEGQLMRDQAQLRNAQLDLQRYRDLLAKDAIARQQVETQEALVRQLQGTVQSDQAQVDSAKLQLSYTRVTAPIAGRLGLKQVELGSLVRAGDAAGIVTITQTQPMAVVFAVPETHVPLIQRKLRQGEKLAVQAWDRDMKEKLAEGQVSTTDNTIDTATGTLKLKALLDNRDGALFPNQFANMRLQLDVLKNRLVVPTSAVQRGSIGTFVVVVQPDNTVKTQRVQLDAVDGDWQAVQPLQGDLKPGARVVTDGADRLRDGSRVEIVKSNTPVMASPNGARPSQPATPGTKSAQPVIASPEGARQPQTPEQSAQPPHNSGEPRRTLPPEIAEKVKNMSPEERKAFFQRMRERREAQGQ
jgi:multidrug efflux system membrane fusion protein